MLYLLTFCWMSLKFHHLKNFYKGQHTKNVEAKTQQKMLEFIRYTQTDLLISCNLHKIQEVNNNEEK
jgi:hypothetical protein